MPGKYLIAICLVLTASLAGCGRKTMVVPPDTVRPAPIRDLVVRQDEKGITLHWTPPHKSQTGADLENPIGDFIIQRATASLEDFCPSCPLDFRRVAKTNAHEWHDPAPRPGMVHSYRVISQNGIFGLSLPSEPGQAAWDTLPPVPEPPTLTPGDGQVTINWPGNPDYGFELERISPAGLMVKRREDKRGASLELIDREVVNGAEYRYRLRLVANLGQGLILRGASSSEVTVTPHDLTPPPQVTGVRAILAADEVRVFWDPVLAADLAAYRIYRKVRERRELIGERDKESTSFIDRNLPTDSDFWQYTVVAVDSALPGNQSAPSRAATVRRIH